MSKNITIQEGGTDKSLNSIKKIKTAKQGSGDVLWIPEDEVNLGTKTITKNGTYKASKSGFYGFSKVLVNVSGGESNTDNDGDLIDEDGNKSRVDNNGNPTDDSSGSTVKPKPGTDGSSVVGKDSDGNEYYITTDENGNLVKHVLPSRIQVTTLPTKDTYSEGETIDMTGAVVMAYKGDGTVWNVEDYSGGVIPISEVTIDPTTAEFNSTDMWTDNNGVNAKLISVYEVNDDALSGVVYRSDPIGTSTISDDGYAYLGCATPATFYVTQFQNSIYAKAIDAEHVPPIVQAYSNVRHMTKDKTAIGNNMYYYGNYNSGFSYDRFYDINNEYANISILLPISTKNPSLAGTLVPTGSTITASWKRPYDNKALTDDFNVYIGQSYGDTESTSGSENSGGGGSHGF